MEILLQPPKTILYVLIAIVVVTVASMLLKRGEMRKKIISLIITVIVVTVLVTVMYRKGSITVDENGIRTTTFGRIDLTWEDIREVEYLSDFTSTGYALKSKLTGTDLLEMKAGLFLLQNGEKARIVVQGSPDALLLKTSGQLVLLAPDELEALAEEVEKYLPIQGR